MKRIFTAIAAAIVVALTSSAHAQNVTKLVYTANTNSGQVSFSIRDVRKIQVTGGYLNLTYTNGTSYANVLMDNGTVFNKIKNDHPEFLTHNTDTLFLADKVVILGCQSGQSGQSGQSVFAWPVVSTEYIPDGCQLHAQSISKSN